MVGVLNRQRETAKWLKYGTIALSDSSLPSSKAIITDSETLPEDRYDRRTIITCSRSASFSYGSYCTSETSSKMNDLNANGISRMKERDNCSLLPRPKVVNIRDLAETPEERIRTIIENTQLTDDDVRDALWDYVTHKRCYSKQPIFHMDILRIECTCVYRYILETSIEQPQTRWITEPYDSSDGQQPMIAWQQTSGRRSASSVSDRCTIVPNTVAVKLCQPCLGRGVKPCVHCMCTGRARCPFCQRHNFHHDGIGHLHSGRCMHCSGFSFLPCPYCKGIGHTTCGKCKGKGKLRSYAQIKMTTKNITTDLIIPTVENLDAFPVSLLKQSAGITVYHDQCPDGTVKPIRSIPALSCIERVSFSSFSEHEADHPRSKVRMQKIHSRLTSKSYETLESLVQDFNLMFDNACKYNDPESTIYKSALTLQRALLQKKAELQDEEMDGKVPDVQTAVQELLTNIFIAVYNHEDEEGRCLSDSLAELPDLMKDAERNAALLSLDLDKVLLCTDTGRVRGMRRVCHPQLYTDQDARRRRCTVTEFTLHCPQRLLLASCGAQSSLATPCRVAARLVLSSPKAILLLESELTLL